MMLGPASRAGDALPTGSEQGQRDGQPLAARRLTGPVADVVRRAEHAEWLRRRLLERQLHDGAALRISALALQIGVIRHRVPAEAKLDRTIDALQDELHAILQEMREVAGKIYPPLLDLAGLGPALREVADRIPAPTRVHAGSERFGPAAEGAAYFAVTACLDALSADAVGVDVYVRRDVPECCGPTLVVDVVGADARNAEPMLGKVWQLGGSIDVTGEAGAATITARIPCE